MDFRVDIKNAIPSFSRKTENLSTHSNNLSLHIELTKFQNINWNLGDHDTM